MTENMWLNGHEIVAGFTFNTYKLDHAVVLILSHPRFGPLSYYLPAPLVDQIATALQSTLASSRLDAPSPQQSPPPAGAH